MSFAWHIIPEVKQVISINHAICINSVGAGNQGAGSHPEIRVPECQPEASLVSQGSLVSRSSQDAATTAVLTVFYTCGKSPVMIS